MKHIWSVLCRRASIDSVENTISLMDVVEQILFTFPAGVSPPPTTGSHALGTKMQLASLWKRDHEGTPERGRIRVTLKTPRDPQPAIQPELEVDLEGGPHARVLVDVTSLLWRGTGEYSFQIELQEKRGWKTVAEIPLVVGVELTPTKQVPNPAAVPVVATTAKPKKKAPVQARLVIRLPKPLPKPRR